MAIELRQRICSIDVIETLARLMFERGVPDHIPSDNGPELTAKLLERE